MVTYGTTRLTGSGFGLLCGCDVEPSLPALASAPFRMSGHVRVAVVGLTDLGRSRDHNEDTFLIADLARADDDGRAEARDIEVSESGTLFVVADGMGGAAAGELASRMATEAIHAFLRTQWQGSRPDDLETAARHLRQSVEHANLVIHSHALERQDLRGMGTTATAAMLFGRELVLAQIGDSRAYLIRGGVATQLTKDQSLTQRLVDAGELTEEQAERSERRNIILQALGPDARVKVDLTHQPLQDGDVLLLCSDGLSGLVRREEFGRVVSDADGDLDAAARTLVALANERGGPDNVTVVLARFAGDGLPVADEIDPGHHRLPLPDDSDEIAVPTTGFRTSEVPIVVPPQARPTGLWISLLIGLIAAAVWVWLD
jgi:protein phosphatase